MAMIRQSLGIIGLGVAVILFLSSWKFIAIPPKIVSGLWIFFVASMIAMTILDWRRPSLAKA